MKKEQLKREITRLEQVVSSNTAELDESRVELGRLRIELENLDKPEITSKDADNIWEAVNKAIGDFDFDDSENYDIEYQLDYDGRVSCSNIDFQSTDELIDKIVANVCNLFKEVDDNEELDTTEPDNHKPVE